MANPNPKTDHLEPTRWKKGYAPNPAGSSKKQRLTRAVLDLLDAKEGLDVAFVKVGMKAALRGDFRFWSYLWDRIEGKQPQSIDADITTHDGDGDDPELDGWAAELLEARRRRGAAPSSDDGPGGEAA